MRPPTAARPLRATLALGAVLGCSSLPTFAPDAATDASPTPDCGAAVCGGRCVDPARDRDHCGACGRACGEGVDCLGGICSRRVTQLSAELNHTCARTADGAVWCWGTNENGEVGDGSLESTRAAPSRVPGITASYVAAGWTHSCAIVEGGRVRCWGANAARVIADDARAVVRAPEEVPFPGRAVALAVGYGTCALLDDGAVYCRPVFGGAPALPYLRWADHVVAIDGGWGHLCALFDDGAVGCGGRRVVGQIGDGVTDPAGTANVVGPVRLTALPRAVALAANADGNCALADDGAAWCWGSAHTSLPHVVAWTPVRLDVGGAQAIWSRGHGYIVRGRDGALRAWGINVAGGVGDGTTVDRWPPVAMTALDGVAGQVVSFAGGIDHACALLADQTVRCWGSNVRGQVGNGALGARVLGPESPRW
jgi:alpha-tubulin suppressor-like RCC1 family protein